MKFDIENIWVRLGTGLSVVGAAVAVTLLYARMDSTIVTLANGQAEIVKSVGEVRDDLRKLVSEHVSVRQAQAWLELFKALNKAEFPKLSVPDLPR